MRKIIFPLLTTALLCGCALQQSEQHPEPAPAAEISETSEASDYPNPDEQKTGWIPPIEDVPSGFISAASGNILEAVRSQYPMREAVSPDHVTLAFAGDISFAEGYANMNYYHKAGDDISKCISLDLISRMDAADILMANNEFTYSTRGTPLSGKTFTFRARPETAANLSLLSVDIVSLANNHVYDYGEEALLDTMDTLKQQGIPYVGAGRNLEEAKNIIYYLSGGMKIAYVSATQIERSYVFTKEATGTSAGVLRTYDPSAFLEVIRKARASSDFVVVYVHWGTEGAERFEADQQALGRQYVDAGADLVIGCHTHCLQGVEYYKGVPIFYSLGNYWFNSKSQDTGLVEADISPDGLLELRFVPCRQQNCRTSLVTDENEKQRILSYLEHISSGVSIDDQGVIRETPN